MNSLAGESLACAHLGLVKGADDVDTSRQCTERRLQIAQTLGDERGEADAHAQLGSLAHSMTSGDDLRQIARRAAGRPGGGAGAARCAAPTRT